MSRTTIRVLGLTAAALFIALAWLGAQVQEERARVEALVKEQKSLRAELAELEAEYARLTSPLRVLTWARNQGFTPATEGRWMK